MDFQSQVAARRAELEAKAREARQVAAEHAVARQFAERTQREEVVDALAADLSRQGIDVGRRGEDLEIAETLLANLDVRGLRKAKVQSLAKREARKMWSPIENWQVIGMTVAGLFLVTFFGLGLLLILAAMLRGSALNKRYRARVRERYPALFSPACTDV